MFYYYLMEESQEKSVYVEGLPYSYSKEELENFFEDCGEIL
jgi:RNA recognition motif-containing protein